MGNSQPKSKAIIIASLVARSPDGVFPRKNKSNSNIDIGSLVGTTQDAAKFYKLFVNKLNIPIKNYICKLELSRKEVLKSIRLLFLESESDFKVIYYAGH
jgi:hypothetical protein